MLFAQRAARSANITSCACLDFYLSSIARAFLLFEARLPPFVLRAGLAKMIRAQVRGCVIICTICIELTLTRMDKMDARKNWTQQQDQLRKALSSKAHFDEAIALFLSQHAAVHTARISGGAGWSLHDEVLGGLSETQIKRVPRPGQNSIAWLLWHITRIEDMTINSLSLEQPQVWSLDWAARLGYPLQDCGASMDETEVADFSARICVPALLEYRAAVGAGTRLAVARLNPARARETVATSTIQKLVEEGSITPKANWLFEYYTNRTRAFFLTRTATSHNFIHLNEAGRLAVKFASVA